MTVSPDSGARRSKVAWNRFLLLPFTLAAVTFLVTSLTFYALYRAEIRQQRHRLVEAAQSQAHLIESMVKSARASRPEEDPAQAFDLVVRGYHSAVDRVEPRWRSGEIAVATLEGEVIRRHFGHRQLEPDGPRTVQFSSDLATPMRRALTGESGLMEGLDYRGEGVIAAYEPLAIPGLTAGLVAKVDLSELRRPFSRAGIALFGVTVLLISLGTYFFRCFGEPLVRELEESERKYRGILQAAPGGIGVVTNRVFVEVNEGFCRMLGYSSEELVGESARIVYPSDEEFARVGREKYQEIRERGIGSIETQLCRRDGGILDVFLSSVPLDKDNPSEGVIFTVFDLTDRKRSEEALRESEVRFRTLVETSTGLIWQTDADGMVTYMNQFWEQATGWALEEILGRSFLDFVHPDRAGRDRHEQDRLLGGGTIREYETVVVGKTGARVRFVVNGSSFRDSKGAIVGCQCTAFDVTEQRRAEEMARTSDRRFRDTFELAPVGIAHATPEGRLVRVNDQMCRILGRSRDELLGVSTLDFIPPEHLDEDLRDLRRLLAGEADCLEKEVRYLDRTGQAGWIHLTVSIARDLGRKAAYFIGVIEDITERKRVEGEVLESRGQLRALTRRLQEVREEERASIARALHDDLGQNLTALKMDLSLLERGLLKGEGAVGGQVRKMMAMADENLDLVQTLSSRLRSPVLDVLGIRAAVEWQVEEFSARSGVKSRVEIEDGEWELEGDRATAAFRILQEALTNVARHAKANRVVVRMGEEGGRALLVVEDDGVGLRPGVLEGFKSLGVLGMRERAEALGGQVDIEPGPMGGTRVAMSLPFEEAS